MTEPFTDMHAGRGVPRKDCRVEMKRDPEITFGKAGPCGQACASSEPSDLVCMEAACRNTDTRAPERVHRPAPGTRLGLYDARTRLRAKVSPRNEAASRRAYLRKKRKRATLRDKRAPGCSNRTASLNEQPVSQQPTANVENSYAFMRKSPMRSPLDTKGNSGDEIHLSISIQHTKKRRRKSLFINEKNSVRDLRDAGKQQRQSKRRMLQRVSSKKSQLILCCQRTPVYVVRAPQSSTITHL